MVQMVTRHTNTYIYIYMYVGTYVVLLAHTDTCAYIFLLALEFDNTLWPVNLGV